jgi:hypothetical protein
MANFALDRRCTDGCGGDAAGEAAARARQIAAARVLLRGAARRGGTGTIGAAAAPTDTTLGRTAEVSRRSRAADRASAADTHAEQSSPTSQPNNVVEERRKGFA